MFIHRMIFSVIFGLVFTLGRTLPIDELTEIGPMQNAGEYGEHFEGDMVLTKEQKEALFSRTRNGLILSKYRWPNKTVPYQLSSNHTKEQQDYIELALKTMESVSCLKFIKRTNEEDYVLLTGENGGCYSSVGRIGGGQILNLQNYELETGCFRLATIMHEFLHALGFYHMQSAYDRDEYVTIHWENIQPGTQGNFNKYTNAQVTHFNTTYDYFSVMHYSAYGFSKNGNATIVPIDESYLEVIGQRRKMSATDVLKLNAMYECDNIDDKPNKP